MLSHIELFHFALRIIFNYFFAVKVNAAVCRRINARYNVKSRCFPGAVGTDERHYFVFVNVKVKVVHGDNAAELHDNIFNVQHTVLWKLSVFHQLSPSPSF